MCADSLTLNKKDLSLVAAIQQGLPLEPRPYAVIAEALSMSEQEVMDRIKSLQEAGVIKRFGVIVRHQELGYSANAMVVWNVPDERVGELGKQFAAYDFVRLCYRRPRILPHWPYNLFCMIHGTSREKVCLQIDRLKAECGVAHLDHEVLFSSRRFKQRGARYGCGAPREQSTRVAAS